MEKRKVRVMQRELCVTKGQSTEGETKTDEEICEGVDEGEAIYDFRFFSVWDEVRPWKSAFSTSTFAA